MLLQGLRQPERLIHVRMGITLNVFTLTTTISNQIVMSTAASHAPQPGTPWPTAEPYTSTFTPNSDALTPTGSASSSQHSTLKTTGGKRKISSKRKRAAAEDDDDDYNDNHVALARAAQYRLKECEKNRGAKKPRKANAKFQTIDQPNQSCDALTSELISRLSNGAENNGTHWISGVTSIFRGEIDEAPLDQSLASIAAQITALDAASTVVDYLRMWYLILFKTKIDRYVVFFN